MNDKNRFPIAVPGIGGGQQLPFDVRQAERKVCNACGWEIFDQVYKIGLISQFASGNTTKKDVIIPSPIYICRACGLEFNVEAPEKQ